MIGGASKFDGGQQPADGASQYNDLMKRLEKMLRDVGYNGGFGSLLRQLVGNNILPGRGGDQIGGGGGGGNGGTGGGGCLDGETMVAMADGTETPAYAIRVDDIVLGFDFDAGLTPQVVTVTNSSRQPCVTVTFENGRSVVASKTHNWFTASGIRSTMQIAPGDEVVSQTGTWRIASIEDAGNRVVFWWNCDPNHCYFAGGVLHHNVTASQTKDPILVPGAGYQPPVVGGTGGAG